MSCHLFPGTGRTPWPTPSPFNGISFSPECCQNVPGFPAASEARGSRGDPAESEDAGSACAAHAHRWAAPWEVLLPPPSPGLAVSETVDTSLVSLRVTCSLPSLAAEALRGQSWGGSPGGLPPPFAGRGLSRPLSNAMPRRSLVFVQLPPLPELCSLKAAATSAPCAHPVPGTEDAFSSPPPGVPSDPHGHLNAGHSVLMFQVFIPPSDFPEGRDCRLVHQSPSSPAPVQ